MATSRELSKKLYYFPKITRWSKGLGAELPEAYKKFWKEWKLTQPAPVHYIPKEGKYELRPDGNVQPIQNVPLPLKYPKELDQGIWGGEAVVRGFVKKHKFYRRTVRYWVPLLKISVVYSEILDKYIRTTVTNRTLNLIHEHYGFDYYILKTPACDLRSLLALKLKREMLIALHDKTLYPDDPVKQKEVYSKYEKYMGLYTREELDWYGLSYNDACLKLVQMKKAAYNPIPMKLIYRKNLIEQLQGETPSEDTEKKSSWISKIIRGSDGSSSTS